MLARILSGLIILLLIFIGYEVIVGNQTQVQIKLPIPTIFNPFPYKKPVIPVKRSYITVLVGDSMVEALGVNANQLRLDLIAHYPSHEFVNYNYGFGSTNILTLSDRLTKETAYQNEEFPPILTQGFDLIIIESFAYNPLSEFPLEEGLTKYEEILDGSIKQIMLARPNSVIALMTPIAPNKENFAKGVIDLTPEKRLEWVKEREAYINKLISYVKEKNIPLINVYEKSLDANGDGDLKYIDSHDYIHPSKEGIKLISKTISGFIFENKIFPQ
jgi:hypothetical protein